MSQIFGSRRKVSKKGERSARARRISSRVHAIRFTSRPNIDPSLRVTFATARQSGAPSTKTSTSLSASVDPAAKDPKMNATSMPWVPASSVRSRGASPTVRSAICLIGSYRGCAVETDQSRNPPTRRLFSRPSRSRLSSAIWTGRGVPCTRRISSRVCSSKAGVVARRARTRPRAVPRPRSSASCTYQMLIHVYQQAIRPLCRTAPHQS